VKEFVETDLSAHEAADRLINAGVEVASVTPLAPDMKGVVIGEVEVIEQDLGVCQGHRLVVARVSTGRERYAVVCGAPNCAPGVRAAFAPPGAVLPGGRRIDVATIRGVVSQGMLCSERELGLGDEHERGILLVGADTPVGADLLDHLGLDDLVLEIEITPNRADCLSVVGLAREIAALTGAPFRHPRISVSEGADDSGALARVRIDDPELCPRYAARLIMGVRVAPSPQWLAARLRAVGLRPISNVVDVTNYVLWELGHPLHAFDYDTVEEHTIVVRRARRGERLTTLDGQERVLDEAMLLIADPGRAIGIAGVMGGANTEVGDRTTRVLLESAYFAPASIRRTSRELGLKTDAAYRFERGADIEGLRDALDRAAQMIADVAGGAVARGVIDVYPAPRARPRVRLRMSRVRRLIGSSPTVEQAAGILNGLGLPVHGAGDELDVEVPTFRRDIGIEDDLVEEIIRVWGYDKIPSTLPSGVLSSARQPSTVRQAEIVRRALVDAGLTEVVTYSFADPAVEAALGRDPERAPMLRLLNPLSQDASLLRCDLLPGMLRVATTNARRQQPNVRIFEIGAVFRAAGGQPAESRWLAIALTGARAAPAWYATAESVDIYDAKGLAEHVLAALGIRETALDAAVTAAVRAAAGGEASSDAETSEARAFEEGRWGRLVAEGRRVALFGEIGLRVREAFDLPSPVFAALIPLDELLAVSPPPVRFAPLPRHPAVQRDLAFVIPLAIPASDVERVIRQEGGPLLRSVTLFDLYAGEGIERAGRSIAWRLTFRADDRTLTDAEVSMLHEGVIEAVRRRFGVELRGGR
jgi:phenylalanyl-tRNA synthetase beta chain